MEVENINNKLINISETIVNKLSFGIIFDNIDYCMLYASIVARDIFKNYDSLELSDLEKEKVTNLYNHLI